ncbi:putative Spindle pole protein Nnf1 [Taphrina deformans PYCC 5710]|uniref:Spindle pole protein Nnf1 n=1 Tax=Taphrina deformans (strain PYCC 5710 / ATCC 11124 / CBS 356.35 / IMI 108563 / JCM 9778 / NBRC 8474) TaxID=1097556 RepID=R4XBU9_TAPDE|nr:putative Spindle pole protein Nnf1 [Taphrina deformans PYCC 5710]|eukprot:CCG83045.1 putative Spindle pole protein Nnf1 [Taphrina deformans PYCC 5710]
MSDSVTKGARASKLDDILNKSLAQTLRACSLEKLTSCFPTLATNDPETLRHAQEQLVDFLTSACRSEFDKILSERQAIARLNELDDMIRDAKTRKERGEDKAVDASDLSPAVILRAHMVPIKKAEVEAITTKLADLQRDNAIKLRTIEEQRRQIELRTKTLKDALGTLDAVVASTTSTNAILKPAVSTVT